MISYQIKTEAHRIGGGGGNSLNLIRLLACFQVMIGHLGAHLELYLPRGISDFFNIFYGVPIFFCLSGFLIWQSIGKCDDIKIYFDKRILRLYPELWGCLIIELASIAIFYDQAVPIQDYILFGFTQGTFFQFWTPDSLRGYGCGTPNGSLWTITIIVQFYILIWFLYHYLKKSKFYTWIIIILFSIIYDTLICPILETILPTVVYKLLMQNVVPYLWLFMIGAFLSQYVNQLLPYLKKYWSIFLVASIFFMQIHLDVYGTYPVLRCIFLSLFIIGFAYNFPQINVKKDISYGIYIYHMIFVNIAIQLDYQKSWTAYFFIVLTTVITAYLSYIFIGGISRRKKAQIINK